MMRFLHDHYFNPTLVWTNATSEMSCFAILEFFNVDDLEYARDKLHGLVWNAKAAKFFTNVVLEGLF